MFLYFSVDRRGLVIDLRYFTKRINLSVNYQRAVNSRGIFDYGSSLFNRLVDSKGRQDPVVYANILNRGRRFRISSRFL